MTPSYLWRNRWPIVGWGLFALALAGLGVLLFVTLPPEPRWTINDGPRVILLVKDDWLATCLLPDGSTYGPVQLWDMATGRELDRFLSDGPAIAWHGLSVDGRWFAAVTESARPGTKPGMRLIRRVDLRDRKESAVEAPLGKIEYPQFSGDGEFLAVGHAQGHGAELSYVIVDTTAGRVVDRFTIPVDANEHKVRKPLRLDGEFSKDGRYFVISYVEERTPCTRVVSTRTGKALVLANAAALALALDSQSLIADRGADGVWIWDMRALAWRCPLDGTPTMPMEFSPDRRLMACVQCESKRPAPVRFFDLNTGAVHWEFQSTAAAFASFSPDGRYFFVTGHPTPMQTQLILCDAHRKHLWEKSWADDFGSPPLFTPDSETVIATFFSRVEFLDAASGDSRRTISVPGAFQLQTSVTNDGRTLLVEQRPGPGLWSNLRGWLQSAKSDRPWLENPSILHAYDVETGQELGQLEKAYSSPPDLTPDRRSLVTHRHHPSHGEAPTDTIIECWDLPPATAWRWVLGVPLALGVALLAFRFGWRRSTMVEKGDRR